MKYTTLALLILFKLNCFAQSKAKLEYFTNEKSAKINTLEAYALINSDTIILTTTRNSVDFQNLTQTFALVLTVNGKVFKFPKCDAKLFRQNTKIGVGTITDFTVLKKSPSNPKMYYIKDEYGVIIDNIDFKKPFDFMAFVHREQIDKNHFITRETGIAFPQK